MFFVAQTETPVMLHGTIGEAVDFFIAFFKTPPGLACIVLAAGLVVLRIYYAARSAVNHRADLRLGPPRGFLAGYFAKVRLEQLKRQRRFEEAAELLAAWQPGRGVEVAELLIKAKQYARAASILVAHKRLRTAADTYVRAGSFDLAAELFERAEDFSRAEENYLRAGNKLAAAALCARSGRPEKAARYYADAERPREAAEQLEKAGKTREAAEKYVEALALVERAGSLEATAHPREKLKGGNKLRDELCDKTVELYGKIGDADKQVEILVDRQRPNEAAAVLRGTGRHHDAARLLVEHDLIMEAQQVLDEIHAGNTTRRKIFQRI
jgi:tetratricopeptide (TPR) repeat protein